MPDLIFSFLLLRLRTLRTNRGLTQEAFAEKAQISYKYYQAIEAGRKRDLRLSTLAKLARAHNISLANLLEESRAPARVAEKSEAYKTAKPKRTRTPGRKK